MFAITSARRFGFAAIATTAAVLAVASLTTAPVASAGSTTTATPGSTIGTRYAVNQRICPPATTPHTMSCYAMKQVPATRSTPGAYRVRTLGSLSPRAVPAGCHGSNPIGLGPTGLGYTPADLAAAYGYNAATPRAQQLVAIIDWFDDPNALKNLNTFDACYGFHKETATSFRKVNQDGRTSPLPKRDADSGVEITLDIQSVRAVCHTCRIVLIEAKGPSDADLAIAENRAVAMHATEISNSFGEPEQKMPAAVLAAYNHPGVVITASTGDDGWFGWDLANDKNGSSQNHAAFPATDQNVVAVGGTAIGLTQSGARNEEVVWNENGVDDQNAGAHNTGAQGAGGGGCSGRYPARAWQADYADYDKARCHGHRLAADISAIADPQTGFDVYDTFGQSGWMTIGGTSLASPVTAAMFALAGGSGGAAYPASSLYVNAARFPSSVFDVVPTNDGLASGNSFCGGDTTASCGDLVFQATKTAPQGGTHNPNALGAGNIDCSFPRNNTDPATPPTLLRECNTEPGLDGPTGLGTPNSLRLFTSTAPKVAINWPTTVRKGRSQTFHTTAAERLSGTHVTSYLYNFGDGHSLRSTTAGVHHTFARPGTYKVSLTVADNLHQLVIATHKVTVH